MRSFHGVWVRTTSDLTGGEATPEVFGTRTVEMRMYHFVYVHRIKHEPEGFSLSIPTNGVVSFQQSKSLFIFRVDLNLLSIKNNIYIRYEPFMNVIF